MANEDIKILIVDDDENNRFCATHNLKRFIGYPNFAEADDGNTALEYLAQNHDVDIILLDRMMPGLSGIPTMQKLNADPAYKNMIVVFQTGEVSKEDKQECINAGSLYLLQKPYDDICMAELLRTISHHVRANRNIRKKLANGQKAEDTASFQLKTFAEAEDVAANLALHYPEPEKIYDAIYELLINAIEHGNLELGYEAKRKALKQGDYMEEINKRLEDDKYKTRHVTASIIKDGSKLVLTIKDEGKGFDRSTVLSFGPDRLREPNGRGIFKAEQIFAKMEYAGKGSEVKCWL